MPIYDQSYAHWTGTAKGHGLRWLPITATGIRLAWRSKRFRLLFLLALVPFVLRAGFIVLVNYAAELELDLEVPARVMGVGDFYHNFLLRNSLFGVIVACLFAGAPLVARDRKAGALEIYFSKPLLLRDYFLGKFLVIAFFLACVTLFPAVFLYLTDLLLSPAGKEILGGVTALPRIAGVSMLVIVVAAFPVLAASALTRSARAAAVVWFSFHVVLFMVARIAAHLLSYPDLLLLDPRAALVCLSERIFSLPPTCSLGPVYPALYLGILCALSLVVILRSLRAVEVVRT